MNHIFKRGSSLREMLASVVPVGILGLQHKGGPDSRDRRWLQGKKALDELLVEADVFADDCVNGKDDARRNTLAILCRAVSIMAFRPGGVEVLGVTYEAKPIEEAPQGGTP